jgi:predicted amidohydrolase
MTVIGRPVRIRSLCFPPSPPERVLPSVRLAASERPDIILLPETWQGFDPLPQDHAAFRELCGIAKAFGVYILHSFFYDAGPDRVYNAAFLLDRSGNVQGRYDKVYPYWAEFDMPRPVTPGKEPVVFHCDFGRLGVAVCFDANFPCVFSRLAELGAELIAWPSAYAAGDQLRAHVLNHHIPIITSTGAGSCLAFDCAGRAVYESSSPGLSVNRVTLDLDECVFHENFNMDARDRLLGEHPPRVAQACFLQREQWFIMRAARPGILAREVCASEGMEELPAYKARSLQAIDRMRYQAACSLDYKKL